MAKKRGYRKPRISKKKIESIVELYCACRPVTEIARRAGVCISTVYYYTEPEKYYKSLDQKRGVFNNLDGYYDYLARRRGHRSHQDYARALIEEN